MSGRSQVKVLEKPDDWWTWNAYITSLAETLWSARYTPGREALPRSADSTDPSIDSSHQQARSAPVEPQLREAPNDRANQMDHQMLQPPQRPQQRLLKSD